MGFHDIPVARRGIANPLAAMALIARGRRMKIARIGTAVALAALLVFVATEVVTRSL
ncbi:MULTISPECIES: hypothetical protein [unclassified Ensifer]|uniref:hypothetical protein n=1 Tax=unclassified Ensifer TaxID=2633371 RepID=UPI001785DE38|nr:MULTISPECIES: hypothetical protein [unclassified Ensifer]MBD9524518.1 hypothetical protein [Ensifer sp. ENS02]MBD9560118.1 hypothetical protein [Ensifer sp. ENS03]